MALVTETPESDIRATERTRKIAFWIVSAIIALFVLWWSFDLLQLWAKQGEELSSKQQELTSITVENAELEEKRDAVKRHMQSHHQHLNQCGYQRIGRLLILPKLSEGR